MEAERRPFQFSLRTLLITVAAVSLLLGIGTMLVRGARDAMRRASCSGLRMTQINLALMNYESTYGCFAPAYVADEEGKPMHSWRVLILPFLERDQLYEQYDFSEPWNGPNNRRLANQMPGFSQYQCPTHWGRDQSTTNYVAVVGPRTAWPGATTVNYDDITDFTGSTILVVEVADSDIHWMEPRDMTFEQAIRGVNVDRKRGISSNHRGGACCSFADGPSYLVPNDTPSELLEAMLTINGGELIFDDGSGNRELVGWE